MMMMTCKRVTRKMEKEEKHRSKTSLKFCVSHCPGLITPLSLSQSLSIAAMAGNQRFSWDIMSSRTDYNGTYRIDL